MQRNYMMSINKGKAENYTAPSIKDFATEQDAQDSNATTLVSSREFTTLKKIPTIIENPTITGTCYIYVYNQNGMYKKIKVTLKK